MGLIKILLYLTFEFILLHFFSLKVAILGLIALFLKWLYDMGIFTSITFFIGNFNKAQVFFTDYTGPYHDIGKKFEQVSGIISKFNLDETYTPFGIYYDDPKVVEPTKCRAVVGILKKCSMDLRSTMNKQASPELMEYLLSNGFKSGILSDTASVMSNFYYINKMSMMLGTKKFYSALEKNLNDSEFTKTFNIDKAKISCFVEVYTKNNIYFYIPVKNHEQFNLHTNK